MTSDKKSVSLLADLFIKKGLSDIVISPGSRNAPIILAFANQPEVNAISIVDERSAAFFALGMAQEKKRAVAIACTSGSAPLNYAPAIAEAYYQKVPLLVFTADRPEELIDVGDGQTIRQKDVYRNYIKASFELPENLNSQASFDLANQIINRAIDMAHYSEPGPVHINLPFTEPLYNVTEESIEGKILETKEENKALSEKYADELTKQWNGFEKILLIAGQQDVNENFNQVLSKLISEKNLVLLTETTSNLFDENVVGCIDNVLTAVKKNEIELFKPDLLITFGGQVVSKKIKKFLREMKPIEHWHISKSGEEMDTYLCLTKTVKAEPSKFFEAVLRKTKPTNPSFATIWLRKRNRIVERREDFLANIAYSDLQVFDMLLQHIPVGTTLHLGNSTPVRYAQLFGTRELITYRSNRGVSGIDGQVSTTAGAAFAAQNINLLITGDLGFLYDSNGLMNRNLTPNLKIIVINNGGGGIFRFIPGPDTSPQLEKFFETKHNWSVEKITEAFGVKYKKAENIQDILYALPEFFNETEKPVLMEIFTPGETNAEWLRRYFEYLKG
jgi:2-succinyl-5-enolpyruvyl-6-hydroxy-3-cyclohexene-1-carboxylate synthase